MGRARWVRVDWLEILEGWAQKMNARKKNPGCLALSKIGPRANWVRAGLAHTTPYFFLYYYFFYHIHRIF